MIETSPIVACICEGGAETAIIDILVDNDKLVFSREQMLNEEVIRTRKGKAFEEKYLRKDFDSKITILRILDSHSEIFKLSAAYKDKIDVINVVTSPEIEMLLILAENQYDEYSKVSSKMKPSEFCKQKLKFKQNIKSQEFVLEYFKDVNFLIKIIKEYKKKVTIKKGEKYLADLLDEK